jgi:hypothetical protein
MEEIQAGQIIAELVKHGWEKAAEDVSHAVIARRSVRTFRGLDFAKVKPLIRFEDGDVGLSAEFISKGENALSGCTVYIANPDDIVGKVAEFCADVLIALSHAFSVRMA